MAGCLKAQNAQRYVKQQLKPQLPMSTPFPECVARVPDSLWCVGVEGAFARRCDCVRNRLQPFAWGPMAVPVTAGNG